MESSRLVAFAEATTGGASGQRCCCENRAKEFGWFDSHYLMARQALLAAARHLTPSQEQETLMAAFADRSRAPSRFSRRKLRGGRWWRQTSEAPRRSPPGRASTGSLPPSYTHPNGPFPLSRPRLLNSP